MGIKHIARYGKTLFVVWIVLWGGYLSISNGLKNLSNLALLHFLTSPTRVRLTQLAQAQRWSELRVAITPTDESAQGQWQSMTLLMNRYSEAYFTAPLEASNIFEEGLVFEQAGRLEESLDAYQRTIGLNAFFIPAYYKLWRLYSQLGSEVKAASVIEELGALAPEYAVNQLHGIEQWTLTGYSLDEINLETMQQFPGVLYWQSETPICAYTEIILAQAHGDEFYCMGDKVYQVTTIENLVPVGEEIYRQDFLEPTRYQSGCQEQACSQQILATQRGGIDTIVFALINRSDADNALVSPAIAVEPSTIYLLSGWIKVDQGIGAPRLGVVCFGKRWRDGQRYVYITKQKDVPEWEHFGGLIHTNADEYNCRVLLLNYAGRSEVYFDDIVFGQLALPKPY